MPTFQQRIEAIIGESLTSSTVPTPTQVGYWIQDGVKCVVNNVLISNPAEALKFTTTTEDANDSGVIVSGRVISVVREDGTNNNLRPATLIDAADRYEATNADSLSYRSKYNPGWYILDRKVHTVPASASGNNSAFVTHLTYPILEDNPSTGSALDSSSEDVQNFPDEYEYLVMIYAAAFVCKAKANECQSLLPSLNELTSVYQAIEIPDLPRFNPPSLEFNLTDVRTQMTAEDIELADKEFEIVSKKIEKYDKELEVAKQKFDREMNIFNKRIDSDDKDKEREVTTQIAVYKEKVAKFEQEITKIAQKYAWWESQSVDLMNQFMNGLRMALPQSPQPEESKKEKRGK